MYGFFFKEMIPEGGKYENHHSILKCISHHDCQILNSICKTVSKCCRRSIVKTPNTECRSHLLSNTRAQYIYPEAIHASRNIWRIFAISICKVEFWGKYQGSQFISVLYFIIKEDLLQYNMSFEFFYSQNLFFIIIPIIIPRFFITNQSNNKYIVWLFVPSLKLSLTFKTLTGLASPFTLWLLKQPLAQSVWQSLIYYPVVLKYTTSSWSSPSSEVSTAVATLGVDGGALGPGTTLWREG